ncbi:MAG: DUF2934 domain-containing protein [Magnetospirillum sp.]|nr:DUF2934 domain-containing protein [Magnetospirillum sp.]
MNIDENTVRRRAYRTWEAAGRPADRFDEHMERARREIEAEFRRAVEHIGDTEHRLNPPLHVEEALLPGQGLVGERRS